MESALLIIKLKVLNVSFDHHPLRPDCTQDNNNTVVEQYVNYWIMKSIKLQNTRCSFCTNFSLLAIVIHAVIV